MHDRSGQQHKQSGTLVLPFHNSVIDLLTVSSTTVNLKSLLSQGEFAKPDISCLQRFARMAFHKPRVLGLRVALLCTCNAIGLFRDLQNDGSMWAYDCILISQPVRTFDCIVHVPPPVVILHAKR